MTVAALNSQRQTYSLSQLMSSISSVLSRQFNNTYWIHAEIASYTPPRDFGHCYFELIEGSSDQGNIPKAKIRATIWRESFVRINAEFQLVTGSPLKSGINILALVQVQMHPVYGLSLNVLNIDPSYTVGDLERKRRETIVKLKENGLYDLNKHLPVPTPIINIAVISSPTAAGYGDFMNQLVCNKYGFNYSTQLFDAKMQGQETTSSIIHALHRINESEDQYDIVVIIRGGGSPVELSVFDDYILAEAIAQFPLPIISGIGHERDVSVVDEIVSVRCKTPTAVAEYLVQQSLKQWSLIDDIAICFVQSVQMIIHQQKVDFDRTVMSIVHIPLRTISIQQNLLSSLQERMVVSLDHLHQSQSRSIEQVKERLYISLNGRYQLHLNSLKQSELMIKSLVEGRLQRDVLELNHYSDMVRAMGVQSTLSRGFAIVKKHDRFIKKGSDLVDSDQISIRLSDGIVNAVVHESKE